MVDKGNTLDLPKVGDIYLREVSEEEPRVYEECVITRVGRTFEPDSINFARKFRRFNCLGEELPCVLGPRRGNWINLFSLDRVPNRTDAWYQWDPTKFTFTDIGAELEKRHAARGR